MPEVVAEIRASGGVTWPQELRAIAKSINLEIIKVGTSFCMSRAEADLLIAEYKAKHYRPLRPRRAAV